MSSKHSLTPPTSSPAAGSDGEQALVPRVIAEAMTQVADYGIYGALWLNRDLIVEGRYGQLVDFVAKGRPVTDSVLAFFGLEDEIRALEETPGQLLELPAIAVATPDGSQKKINFTIFWQERDARTFVLAYRANSQTELELELSRQIRARLMAEEEISAKSKELARANADLESFAAIVSHDLKAPLRHMRYLADDVILSAPPDASGETAEKLRQLQSLSRRMSHMLTELFDYASLGRKYEALAAADTRQLAESIVASLPASGMVITISGTWPVFTTLAAPLDLVIRNLVQNAIQHHDRAEGRITIEGGEEAAALIIRVSDDGPGIAREHHAAVFRPFRTLKAPGAASGTGMGLAMVKKTIETAGGAIEITSDPARARGTTFTVRWPKFIAL